MLFIAKTNHSNQETFIKTFPIHWDTVIDKLPKWKNKNDSDETLKEMVFRFFFKNKVDKDGIWWIPDGSSLWEHFKKNPLSSINEVLA